MRTATRQTTLRCLLGLTLLAGAGISQAATWTVGSTTPSGGTCAADPSPDASCTLRQAISQAIAGDTIRFSSQVQGQTISISQANQTLNIDKNLTIDGSPGGVILDGSGLIVSNPSNGDAVVHIESGNVTLNHLTIQGNTCSDLGCGIFNLSNLELKYCRVTDNHTTNSVNGGGGIYSQTGSLTIDHSTIDHNSAEHIGGGIRIQSATTVVLRNSTVAYNTSLAAYGGGISSSSALSIEHSSVAYNTAPNGGGIVAEGSLYLFSSIIAGNTASVNSDIYADQLPQSLGFNLVGDKTTLSGSSPIALNTQDIMGVPGNLADPQFAASGLANNGGFTPTLALQSTSPVIGNGNCASVNANLNGAGNPAIPAITTDQRDYPHGMCSSGSFEYDNIFYATFEGF